MDKLRALFDEFIDLLEVFDGLKHPGGKGRRERRSTFREIRTCGKQLIQRTQQAVDQRQHLLQAKPQLVWSNAKKKRRG